MRGQLHVIPSDVNAKHRVIMLTHPVTFGDLIQYLGGHFELIPGFDSVEQEGGIYPCLAFRNSDPPPKNYGLKENQWAYALWRQAYARRFGPDYPEPGDTLFGPVVIVSGDPDFLNFL